MDTVRRQLGVPPKLPRRPFPGAHFFTGLGRGSKGARHDRQGAKLFLDLHVKILRELRPKIHAEAVDLVGMGPDNKESSHIYRPAHALLSIPHGQLGCK